MPCFPDITSCACFLSFRLASVINKIPRFSNMKYDLIIEGLFMDCQSTLSNEEEVKKTGSPSI